MRPFFKPKERPTTLLLQQIISYVDQSSSTIDSEVSCYGMIRPRARFNHAHLPLDHSGTIALCIFQILSKFELLPYQDNDLSRLLIMILTVKKVKRPILTKLRSHDLISFLSSILPSILSSILSFIL